MFYEIKRPRNVSIVYNIFNVVHMERDRHNFLSFYAIFCFFAPLLTPKIKIWKKCTQTPGDIILLHMSTFYQDRMVYGS